ncbi:uncharacterized protein LOC100899813 [Galendromus occidentalis]|uniref:Uncharacterized protein LOC100899813 n=1 Tax=Galendromus occidentalis TaxID=34638 RepID=A0AAJ7WJP3_9ACAR|nr:uncharacterized protein LOC100899813 [Galendromus occidentalis]
MKALRPFLPSRILLLHSLIYALSLSSVLTPAVCHDGGILATLTQTIHHLFERPVINIGVQPLNYGHGIKLGVDAVIKTRKHPKKTTHHHHHHYDEEEEVIEEHVIDHHRTGEAKQSSRPRPRISFELGRPRSGGGLTVSSAPKLTKRKKFVPKDMDDDNEDGKSYRKKTSDELSKGLEKDRHEPYIRASSNRAYKPRNLEKSDVADEEPPAAASGPMAEYERRSFHSAGSMGNDDA